MSEYPDQDQADVTMPTLAEMERCATILPRGEVIHNMMCDMSRTGAAAQLGASASQLSPWSIVHTSPHDARLASLEAEVARLMAANAVLQRGMQIIAAADVPEPAKAGIPARALGCHPQRIGLLTGIW